MALHLQNRRLDGRRGQHFLQPLRFKVGKSDGAHLALSHGLFHVAPRAEVIAKLLMEQQKVYVVRAEAGEHPVDARHGPALAVFAGPELGGNPNLIAGNAAPLHRRADAALVLIGMGRVDVVVSGFPRTP